MFKVLFQTVGIWTMLLAALLAGVQVGVRLIVPRIFRSLVDSLVHPNPNESVQWLYALSFFFLPIIGSFVNNAHDITMARTGLQMNSALSSTIFRKSLRIDMSRKWASETLSLNQGTIVNLMANDARRLQYFMFGINDLWIAPTTVAVGMYLLYAEVDWATFVGVGVMV